MKKNIFLLLAAATLFFSCDKDPVNNNNTTGPMPIPAPTPLTGSVAGNVVDENNGIVANAQVIIAGVTYTTDSRGFFNTPPIVLDKFISTVTVIKQGYYKAIRSFSANATKNYVSIKLIPKTLRGTFNSSVPGAINLSNGSQVTFVANSENIISTGAAYTGAVNVYASYIDPTVGDIGATIPGSFMGEDASKIYLLQSAGIIAVELESATGQPLQLAPGKTAAIKLAIPASLLSKVPATIDTWSLDDRGVWIKEGTATKNGNFYEMQVSHFSFWNVDYPMNSVYATLNIRNQNNKIMPNIGVRLKVVTNSTSWGATSGFTDSLGNVSGLIPANEKLELSLLSDFFNCSSPSYTQNIGPFSAATSLTITGTINPLHSLSVSGTVKDCNGQPLTSGSVIVATDYHAFYTTVQNGAYNVDMVDCNSFPIYLNVTVIDNLGQQQYTAPFTATQNTINTGSLTSCGTSTLEFINYTLDGTSYVINSSTHPGSHFWGDVPGNYTRFYFSLPNWANGVQIGSNTGAAVGTFPGRIDSLHQTYFYPTMLPNATITYTSFGSSIGQFIEGTFTLPFTKNSVNHTFTGSFRIRRD